MRNESLAMPFGESSPQVPRLLIPDLAARERSLHVGLPPMADNLFARIIRNPASPGLPPRERACTEMLCAVLRNAPTLREHLLRAMARLVPTRLPGDLGRLEYELRTEGSVSGGKRDDLRIDAWADQERSRRVLLWSFEVKVAAGFHESPPFSEDAGSSDTDSTTSRAEVQHQLLNYDGWLSRQVASSVEGFVLARSPKEWAYPLGLQLKWPCITWTRLGLWSEAALRRDLPAEDRFLARHLAGFVRSYLWSREEEEKEMGEPARIDIDDIALMRAFGALGAATKGKIDELVEPVVDLLRNAQLGLTSPEINRALFKASARTIAWTSLSGRTNQPPYLCAGVVTERGTDLVVWIETSPKFKLKDNLHRALGSVLDCLNERAKLRRPQWRLLDPADGLAWDIELRLPLERLLGEDDQKAKAQAFFADAFQDLKTCDVIRIVKAVIDVDSVSESSTS